MSRVLEDLKHYLSELFNYLNSKYYINSGGCCYIASVLARELERLNIKYWLVIYNDKDINSRTRKLPIRRAIKNRDPYQTIGIGKNVCVYYAITTSELGVLNSNNCDKNPYLKSVSLAAINSSDIEWIYKTGDWNRCYNTKFNKIIRDCIHLAFKGYEIRKENEQED